MYYKKIYIRDFGIFQNQTLNNISKNLVVIGGKNRAGKSTFLKLLRYLPYGLPQNNLIPPAANQYYIEAELERENVNYNLSLEGYASPRLRSENNNYKTAADLFNQLDQLSYQHLFSISLDELQHLSRIARGKKKEKRLYSILLGAGFSELVKVPELADKYFNNARNIGGKLGDPSVAEFKPYYKEIKAAEKRRDQALLEINEFSQKRNKLKEKQEKLDELKKKIKKLENRYFLVDLLKNNYSKLEEITEMRQKLDSQQKSDDLLAFIKKQRKKIVNFEQKEELIREKLKSYQAQKDRITAKKQKLIAELENLNSSWKSPLQQLERIEFDLIEEQKLKQKLKEYEQLKQKLEKIKSEIKSLEYRLEENEMDLKKLKFKDPSLVVKHSYLILAFSFLSLASSFFADYNQLRYLSLILGLAAFIYYSSNYKSSRLEKEKADKLRKEIKITRKQIDDLQLEKKNNFENLNMLKTDLDNYAQILGVFEKDYMDFIDSYYREIKDQKRRLSQLKIEEAENEERLEELKSSLIKLKALITEAALYCNLDFTVSEETDLFKNSQVLFSDFKLLKDLLNLTDNYLTQKSQLEETLNSSDRIKKALTEIEQDGNSYQIFKNLFQEFSSLRAVKSEQESLTEKLNKFKQEREELDENITTLKNRINELSTSTKIEKAQQTIDQAQTELEKKAQDYAVHKSAAYILKKLRSRMIEKAEKELLEPAADILSRISSNHYSKLKTAANLDQSDFRIITAKDQQVKNSSELSRGSLEQLYLAVRLSRIKEIEPPLPVVLDDSLVNFDQEHLYNTAELISEFALRHQIFVLSCHPDLISFISELTDSEQLQYWKLDSGNFELTEQKKLIDYLSQ
ncbi:MAG: AAA family ATPase [Halanaerobium sp.]